MHLWPTHSCAVPREQQKGRLDEIFYNEYVEFLLELIFMTRKRHTGILLQ